MADGGAPRPAADGTRLIVYRHAGAVVSESHYERVAPEREGLLQYRAIVEAEFARRSCLPVPFGVVFRTETLLVRWLELHYSALLDGLAFVEDRAMARVRAVRRVDRAAPPPAAAAPVAAPASREGQPSGNGGGRAQPPAAPIPALDAFRNLRRLAAASFAFAPSQPGVEESVSFLVERERWEAFGTALREEQQRSPEWDFTLSGPWPPYDFVRMQFGG